MTLNLLTDRPQMVRMEKVCWAPSEQQETHRASYLLSTYDCPSDQDNNIIKYTDEKNSGLIKGRDK